MEDGLEEISIDDTFTLNVKFSDGETVKLREISLQSKIRDIIREIKSKMQEICENENRVNTVENKYMKLIYEGKILTEDQNILQCRITNESVLHCSLSDFPSAQHVRDVLSNVPTMIENLGEERVDEDNEIRVDTLISDPVENDDNMGGNEEPPEGFDRMREQGFSEEEVNFFRNQFYSSRPQLLTQLENGDLSVLDLRRIEEQWMNDEDPLGGTESVVSRNDPVEDLPIFRARQYDGSEWDLFCGAVVGFFFGAVGLMVFCVELGISKKFKVGVMFGMFLNAVFGILALIY